MTTRLFDAVTFDAGNTLFTERRTRDELYCDVFADFDVEVELDVMARWRSEEHAAMPERVDGQPRYSEAWFRAFVARLLERAAVTRDAEALRLALAERFVHASAYRVFEDVPDILAALGRHGYRLAVVSNWSDHLDGILAGLGLKAHFEAVFASAVVGISKPSPQLYRHACARLDLAPERVLHLGDRDDNDVTAARAAGLSAWKIDRSNPRDHGADVVTSFRDLAGRLIPDPPEGH